MTYSIKDIADFIKENKKSKTPFVIFTGAGCSKSAGMPLANELIKEIQQKFSTSLKSLDEEDRNDYGKCMEKLTPKEQKRLLESYIKKSKVNWAHIALASLLKEEYIAKVLTFNFDNILTRACSLENFFPPIYDLEVLSEEYFSLIPNQSIVHLHGQWSGFGLVNATKDAEKQAQKIKNYINNILLDSPSLFVGYSGGSDAFFKLMEKNYKSYERLFWINYSKEPNKHVEAFINKNDHINFLGEQDADSFFIELAIELECFPTSIFKNPFNHLLEICEEINSFPVGKEKNFVDVLKDTKKTLLSAKQNMRDQNILKYLIYLKNGKYGHIINSYEKNNIDITNSEIKKLVSHAYLQKAINLLEQKNNQYKKSLNEAVKLQPKFYEAYFNIGTIYLQRKNTAQDIEEACKYFEQALQIKPDDSDTLNNYGTALQELAQLKQDQEIFQKSFEMYEKSLKIQPDDSDTLNNYGISLKSLAKINQDIPMFQKSFEMYEKSLKIQPKHINALINYGSALSDLANINQDKPMFQQSFEMYKKVLKIQPEHVNALNNYGISLKSLAKINQDIPMFQQSFEMYKKVLKIQPEHVNALNNYGNALQELAKINQDQQMFQQSFEMFDKALNIQPEDSDTLNNYGNALQELAKINQDKQMFQQSFEMFDKALNIQPEDVNALNNYSSALSSYSYISENKDQILQQAFDYLTQAVNLEPHNTYNLACYYALINDCAKCQESLLIAKEHNTLPTKKHLEEDKDLDHVRNEPWFIELLDSL